MKKLLIPALLALGLVATADRARADFLFTATISHGQEVLPDGTIGTPDRGFGGSAILILDDAMTRLTYSIQLTGSIDFGTAAGVGPVTPDPTDDIISMHIHRAPAGVNGPVVFGFFNPNSDNAPDDRVFDPIARTISGVWNLNEGNGVGVSLASEIPFLFAGGLYLNFHTPPFPGGEVRGQITGGQLIPEPSSIVLGGLGILSLAGYGWRRRKQAA